MEKNDQLSVNGAKLDGELKVQVPYESVGSKCCSSNNSPLKLKADHLTCHALLLYGNKCIACKETCPQLEW